MCKIGGGVVFCVWEKRTYEYKGRVRVTVQNARILHGNPERNYLYHRCVEYSYSCLHVMTTGTGPTTAVPGIYRDP